MSDPPSSDPPKRPPRSAAAAASSSPRARRPSSRHHRDGSSVAKDVEPPFEGQPDWRVVRELADGTVVTLRPITVDDREALRRAFYEVSPQTRHSRFLGGRRELSEEMLTYLTDVDQRTHVAIVATTTTPDLKSERGVGVARFMFLEGAPGVVEAAITVADDMQRKGVGTILLRELERAARARNVHRIRAEVLAGNATMRNLLQSVGAEPVETPPDARASADPETEEGQTVSYDIELEPLPISASLMTILRGAAQTMSLTLRRLIPPL